MCIRDSRIGGSIADILYDISRLNSLALNSLIPDSDNSSGTIHIFKNRILVINAGIYNANQGAAAFIAQLGLVESS